MRHTQGFPSYLYPWSDIIILPSTMSKDFFCDFLYAKCEIDAKIVDSSMSLCSQYHIDMMTQIIDKVTEPQIIFYES